jgi:hypothetical protein
MDLKGSPCLELQSFRELEVVARAAVVTKDNNFPFERASGDNGDRYNLRRRRIQQIQVAHHRGCRVRDR